MADLRCKIAGIDSINPFWLASAPPTNSGDQVMRAFDAGWGGAVWKTLGNPIVNVSGRLGSIDHGAHRMMGLNNIELITDRPLDVNFREITEVKKRYPDHALIVSLMVESREEWNDIIRRSEDTGADGLELNFGRQAFSRGQHDVHGTFSQRRKRWKIEGHHLITDELDECVIPHQNSPGQVVELGDSLGGFGRRLRRGPFGESTDVGEEDPNLHVMDAFRRAVDAAGAKVRVFS